MREKRNAPAVKRRAQSGFGEKVIDAEFHGGHCKSRRSPLTSGKSDLLASPLVGEGGEGGREDAAVTSTLARTLPTPTPTHKGEVKSPLSWRNS